MASININRNVTDMFYRYKMPKIIVKVEGKGNGIKTRIVNMADIAKALDRPPSYPTKYFGCELGAQTTIDIRSDKFIVNGSHTADKLQDILDGFIQKFVLCPKCENPETTLTVSKNNINQRCMACGYRGQLKIVHKLTQYITKNPPIASGSTDNGVNKKDKRSKGRKGKKDSDSEEDKSKDENMNGVHAQYQDADRVDNQDSPPPVEDDDDEDWVEEEGEQQNGGIAEQLSSLTMSSDQERSSEERLEIFFNFVENKKRGGSVAALNKEIFAEAERLDIVDKAPYVLTEVLLTESIIKELISYRTMFLRFCNNNHRSQRNLLSSLELLIGQRYPDALIQKTANVLKTLYDTDIIDEEVLIEWHEKASKKRLGKELSAQIHAKAEPFITWLKNAEEESDSDEEEDVTQEVEIEYSYQATSGLQETKVKSVSKEESDDDLNIDDI